MSNVINKIDKNVVSILGKAGLEVVVYPYWIERSVLDDQHHSVWVKIPYLPPQGTRELYLFYQPDYKPPKDPFGDGSEVAYWRLEENAQDEHNTYNGTFHGKLMIDENFCGRKCLQFDGSSYIDISNLGLRDVLNNSYTISVWAYSRRNDDELISFSKDRIRINTLQSDGILINYHKHDDYNYTGLNLNILKGWNHYVITANKETLEGKLYINGTLYKVETDITWENLDSDIGFIGGETASEDDSLIDMYRGWMWNLRIFNRELSYEEVKQLYRIDSLCYEEPEEVFIFFDDFGDKKIDYNKWKRGSSTEYVVTLSYIRLWGNERIFNGGTFEFNGGKKLITALKLSTIGDHDLGIGFRSLDDGKVALLVYEGDSCTAFYCKVNLRGDMIGSSYNKSFYQQGLQTWVPIRIKMLPDSYRTVINRLIGINYFGDFSYANHLCVHLEIDTDSSSRFGYVEYVAVADGVETEPSVIFGKEENGEWYINGIKYRKRKKIKIINNVNKSLYNYPIQIGFKHIDTLSFLIGKVIGKKEMGEINKYGCY